MNKIYTSKNILRLTTIVSRQNIWAKVTTIQENVIQLFVVQHLFTAVVDRDSKIT